MVLRATQFVVQGLGQPIGTTAIPSAVLGAQYEPVLSLMVLERAYGYSLVVACVFFPACSPINPYIMLVSIMFFLFLFHLTEYNLKFHKLAQRS